MNEQEREQLIDSIAQEHLDLGIQYKKVAKSQDKQEYVDKLIGYASALEDSIRNSLKAHGVSPTKRMVNDIFEEILERADAVDNASVIDKTGALNSNGDALRPNCAINNAALYTYVTNRAINN